MKVIVIQTAGELESASSCIFDYGGNILVIAIRPKFGCKQLASLIMCNAPNMHFIPCSGIFALVVVIIAALLRVNIATSLNFGSRESSLIGRFIYYRSKSYISDSAVNFMSKSIINSKYVSDEELCKKKLVGIIRKVVLYKNSKDHPKTLRIIGKHVLNESFNLKDEYLKIFKSLPQDVNWVYYPHPREDQLDLPLNTCFNYPALDVRQGDVLIVMGGSSAALFREIWGSQLCIIQVIDKIFNRSEKRILQIMDCADWHVSSPAELQLLLDYLLGVSDSAK